MDRKANNRTTNSRIKNQGLAEGKNKNRKKTSQTNKQHVPVTHVSSQKHEKHTTNNTKKTKARPRREKGERVDQPKVGKRCLPPPSCQLDILPIHEGVGRERAISKRGGRRDPFPQPGDKRTRPRRREKETDRKGPRAHCKSHRAKINNGS